MHTHSRNSLQKALRNQLNRLDRKIDDLENLSGTLSMARLGTFVGGLTLVYLAGRFGPEWLFWIALAAFIVGFWKLVSAHKEIERTTQKFSVWRSIRNTHLARLKLDWTDIPEKSPSRNYSGHPFASDLNLIGEHSLLQLIDTANALEGLARNAGKHAGGVVIAPSALTDFAPLYCEPGGQGLVTQFDKDDVEKIGLVKFDFLGLRTLTIIDRAVQAINERRRREGADPIDMDRLETDDAASFRLLKACRTTAVFQLESRGMKELIKRLQPDDFEEIVALVALFLVTAAAFVALATWSTQRHYQEVTQRLNANLAMYIAEREPLIDGDGVNHAAMAELAELVMTINPSVEIYLLGPRGRVLDHALPPDTAVAERIDPAPIRQLIDEAATPPVTGPDPRNPGRRIIFSAARITRDGATAGYLYAVLAGMQYRDLAAAVSGSYILRASLAGVGAIVLFALASGALIFASMTRPLRRLAADMRAFQRDELSDTTAAGDAGAGEIDTLEQGFRAMRARIHEQFARLEENDRLRRELVSNVSHDLRTPLASMQGYLETLMIRAGELPPEQCDEYIRIAHLHCRRLSQLVGELFELSKLDAGRMQPNLETFPLAELVQDVGQKFALEAERRGIGLRIEASGGSFPVTGDIALIERVLENLLDNALHHTPAGGTVTVSLAEAPDRVDVAVADTGHGVAEADLPHIFDRYFHGTGAARTGEDAGAGLGLAIVQRILDLHGSRIEVSSTPNAGTTFRFPLDRAA